MSSGSSRLRETHESFLASITTAMSGATIVPYVKAARFAIAESRRAGVVILEGEATSRSPLRQMIELLGRINTQAADRFPLAMQFVRPGFDEPDVAAGVLTSLNGFDPR
jgi:hypothetical protein